jgi:hypothetical protein
MANQCTRHPQHVATADVAMTEPAPTSPPQNRDDSIYDNVPNCPQLRFSVRLMSKPSSSKTSIHKLYNVSQIDSVTNVNVASTWYALTKSLNVNVHVNKEENPVKALIDSGTMGNFVHEDLVYKLGLTCIPRSPLPLLDIKGVKIGELRHQVVLTLRIGVHEERITMDVAPIGSHQVILGFPWLEAHDPDITWSTGKIHFGSHHCNVNCLPHPNDVFALSQPMVTLNYLDIEIFTMK